MLSDLIADVAWVETLSGFYTGALFAGLLTGAVLAVIVTVTRARTG